MFMTRVTLVRDAHQRAGVRAKKSQIRLRPADVARKNHRNLRKDYAGVYGNCQRMSGSARLRGAAATAGRRIPPVRMLLRDLRSRPDNLEMQALGHSSTRQ